MSEKMNNPKQKIKYRRKTGRPKFEIDYEQVRKLASLFSTQEEIAIVLGCHVRTLQRDKEFCRVYKEGTNEAKTSLRRYQFKHAEKNPQMAMFLGKQYLGQSDKIEQKQEVSLSIEDYMSQNPMEM